MIDELVKELNSLEYTKKYRVWEPFMRKHNCQFVAEIGVRNGVNFDYLIAHKPVFAIAVDSWIDDGVISRNDKGYSQEELDKQYENFEQKMLDKLFVRVHREYSSNASVLYPKNVFDFIYLDADHTYEGLTQDLNNWYPKVKPGGYLMGDDYVKHTNRIGVEYGVIEAVKDFTDRENIDLFIFEPNQWGLVKPKQ